jgi:zinc protease
MNSPALATKIESARLDNGLRVVLYPRPGLPLVAVNLWYHVGSKNERPGRTGFAHLFEHMLFQGSQHVGTNEHFAFVQQAGGIANGSTSRDRTNYYETLPAHHLELALWLESDRMGYLLPALSEEKLENQRQVVINERLQRVDNQPYGRAAERVYELLFPPEHPYHWPVIGYREDIAAATLAEVRSFFGAYYRPNNAVLSLAGDFDPRQALAAVERYFGPLPPGPEAPPVTPALAPLGGERREVLEDDVHLPRVYLAFRAPGYGDRRWYAADLLSAALGDGKSSPLYRDLVYERQIAQGVGSYIYDSEAAAVFLTVATARPGVSARELEEALLAHLEDVRARGPRSGDLERARNRITTQYFQQLQRLDRVADLLSQSTTYFDDPGRFEGEAERYLELDVADLTEYARRFCPPEERVVVTVVPAGSEA